MATRCVSSHDDLTSTVIRDADGYPPKELTTRRYAYLKHLHNVHELKITLSGDLNIPRNEEPSSLKFLEYPVPIPRDESSSPTLAEYFALVANILQHVHAPKLGVLSLKMPLTSYQEMEPALRASIARSFGFEFATSRNVPVELGPILRDSLTHEDVLESLRRVERLILQLPALIAMWFDIATPVTRMWDGLVERMFPNLHMKGMLRTIRCTVAI